MYEDESVGYPIPQQQFVKIDNRDPNFNQWFLDNKDSITTLVMLWRGWDKDINGQWYKPKDSEERRLMNEKGIHWAKQLMESYLTNVFKYTNLDREEFCYAMRQAARAVWLGLQYQYSDFGITKINTQVIGIQIYTQIQMSILASRGEGIRKYLSMSQQVSEIRQTALPSENKGMFSGLMSMFGRGRQ
jgi:hypothetical protein